MRVLVCEYRSAVANLATKRDIRRTPASGFGECCPDAEKNLKASSGLEGACAGGGTMPAASVVPGWRVFANGTPDGRHEPHRRCLSHPGCVPQGGGSGRGPSHVLCQVPQHDSPRASMAPWAITDRANHCEDRPSAGWARRPPNRRDLTRTGPVRSQTAGRPRRWQEPGASSWRTMAISRRPWPASPRHPGSRPRSSGAAAACRGGRSPTA